MHSKEGIKINASLEWGIFAYRCGIFDAYGKMALYSVTVPANDTNMDLSAVTLTSVRRIEANPVIRTTEPYALVSIPGYPEIDLDYDVHLTVESASNIGAVGDLILYGKTANGFYIKYTGSADNVVVRWTLVNPDIK